MRSLRRQISDREKFPKIGTMGSLGQTVQGGRLQSPSLSLSQPLPSVDPKNFTPVPDSAVKAMQNSAVKAMQKRLPSRGPVPIRDFIASVGSSVESGARGAAGMLNRAARSMVQAGVPMASKATGLTPDQVSSILPIIGRDTTEVDTGILRDFRDTMRPATAAGSGTVIAPGQDQKVMKSRVRSELNKFNPQSLITKSETGLAIEESKNREQAARDEIAAINAERERLNPVYDSSSPFNMANAAGPRMPTTAEGDLARRSRQAAVGIGDPLSAAEQSQLSEFRAKSYAAANGLPYIPPSAPRQETSRKSLPDVSAEFAPPRAKPLTSFPSPQEFRGLANSLQQAQEIQGRPRSNQEPQSGQGSDDGRIRMRSTVNRQTLPDGRQVTFGGGLNVEAGNIMTTDAAGNKRAVILPSSGNSIGLRTAEVDSQGNFVPGTFKTQSDEARRKERQDLAILKGNEPGASAEDKLAGQQAKEAQDKYAAYKARRDKRRSDALDIRQAANAMRGYGQVGEQFMGFNALGNRMVQPIYGQTGPSLAQAAGMVRQQRDTQERMDNAMKQQREREEQQARQDMILEAYKSNPNDPRLADAFSQQLGLRDRTPEEQSRYDRDQFNLKINNMTENNELTMDPRQVPGAGVGDLDTQTKSKLVAGIDDALKSDLLTDEDRTKLLRNVDLEVMAELIDGTAFDEIYFDGDQSERVYKDLQAFLKRTGQIENKPENDFYQSGTLGGPNDMF